MCDRGGRRKRKRKNESDDRIRHAQKERRTIVTILRKNDNDAIRSINHVTIVLLVLMCMSSSMPSGMDNNDELYTEGHN